MSLIELVPEELRSVEKQEEFLAWLKVQAWPDHIKKYALLDWCELVGVKVNEGMTEKAGIPLQV